MSSIRAVLLDLDGTLVDSNDAHAEAWVEVLGEFGHRIPFARVRPLIGMGSDRLLPEVSGIDAESAEGKRITERRTELFLHSYVERLKPFQGSAELAERLNRDGFRLVVATSANEKEMKQLVRIAGIEPYIHRATNASEAENSKPDPDIVQAALRKAEAAPNEAVMLGDTPYDVQAARAAGVAVIALRSGGWDDDALRGAAVIYADPRELLEHYERATVSVLQRRNG
ncbi:MAG TPA: HAD family hydrolase [Polyangiaceae bacterium]